MTGQAARVDAGEAYQVTAVAFSPGRHHLLAAGITALEDDLVESALWVWDADTGELHQAFEGLRGEITDAVFSPDGSRILTGSTSGTALLWDVETGQEVATLYAGGAKQVTSVAFSRDGTRVLVAANDDMFDDGFPYTHASLLDAESGEVVQVFSGGGDMLRGVAIAPDGSQILIGSENGRAWLSVVEPGLSHGEEEITHIFSEHSEGVMSVAFSPDGRYALTGGQDGTARLWDTGTGEQARVFSGHSAAVNSVAFSSDGRYALTGSSDGTARLWDVDYRDLVRFACSRVFRDFTVGQDDFRQTGNEWNLYAISEGTPTCPRFGGS
jgi:WD40 repeat protein